MFRYKKGIILVLVASLAALVLVACGDSDSSTDGDSGTTDTTAAAGGDSTAVEASSDPYEAVLSINFAGNPVRQEVIKIMELATEKGELAGRVKLDIAFAGESVQEQAQSIDNIARKGPDMILVLPSSGTGLSAAMTRACDAGVTVVAFDSVVTSPCVPSIAPEFGEYSVRLGAWLAEQAEEGSVIVDEGLAGLPAAEEMYKGFVKGIEETNPDIEIVSYESKLTPGGIKAGIANLIPSHRDDLVGIGGISIATAAMAAIEEAGLDPVAQTTVTAVNEDLEGCLTEGQKCLYGAVPLTLGAEAMKLGTEILDGVADESVKRISPPPTWYGNAGAPAAYSDVEPEEIAIGENVFPDLPGSLSQPFSADWLPLTAEEVATFAEG